MTIIDDNMSVDYKTQLSKHLKDLSSYLLSLGEKEWSRFCEEASAKVLDDEKYAEIVFGNFAPTTEFDDFTVWFSNKCGSNKEEISTILQCHANSISDTAWKIIKR